MRVFDLAANTPWLITNEAYDTILTVAARENDSIEAVESRLGKQLDNTATVRYHEDVRSGSRVAVVPVAGSIFPKANYFTRVSGATSTEMLARDFQAAVDDPSITSIILDVDSPGGVVTGIAELGEIIFRARGSKPIVAFASGQCCSAAYWLASAADMIVASPTAMLGSVGVVISYSDKESGVRHIVSSNAKNKRIPEGSPEWEASLKEKLDAIEEVFLTSLSKYRGTSVNNIIKNYGQGDTFVGKYAQKRGMCDGLATMEDLIGSLHARQDVRAAFGANGSTASADVQPKPKEKKMSFLSMFNLSREQGQEVMAKLNEELQASEEKPEGAAATPATPSARESELEASVAALKEQVNALLAMNANKAEEQAKSQREQEVAAAAEYVAGLVESGKVLPFQAKGLEQFVANVATLERLALASDSKEAKELCTVMVAGNVEGEGEAGAEQSLLALSAFAKQLVATGEAHGYFKEEATDATDFEGYRAVVNRTKTKDASGVNILSKDEIDDIVAMANGRPKN